jgi:MFS family permease
MIIPKLPAYLTSLGGGEYKGLIISMFTLTAMISRPFSGKLADTIGRVPIIIVGSGVCFLCSLLYPLLTTVAGFIMLRFLHGFSTGFTPTGQTAFLSDIIPSHRRGEAIGLLGTAGSIGMAGGPALGGHVANAFGLNFMFYCSSALAILSVLILLGLKETLPQKHKFHWALLKVKQKDWFEPRVLAPCIVMVLCSFAYGTSFTLLADFGYHVGIKNEGVLFTYLTIASLVVRLVGGKASDHWGRRPVLQFSSLLIVIATGLIAVANSKLLLIAGVTLYGFAQGATSPTLLAWATDLSDEQHKGRGVASVYIFMELGIGLGAFISGLLYGNDASNFLQSFAACSALAAVAFVYLTFKGISTNSLLPSLPEKGEGMK